MGCEAGAAHGQAEDLFGQLVDAAQLTGASAKVEAAGQPLQWRSLRQQPFANEFESFTETRADHVVEHLTLHIASVKGRVAREADAGRLNLKLKPIAMPLQRLLPLQKRKLIY